MKLTETERIEAQEFCDNYSYKVETGEWTKDFFRKMLIEHIEDSREQSARLKETLEKAQKRWQEMANRAA